MSRKWDREMITSSVLIVLICVRHSVIGAYESDDKPRWNKMNQNQQHNALTAHQQLHQIPHRQHRHHHDDTMHNNNREFHIKSQHHEPNDATMVHIKNRRLNTNNDDAPTSNFKMEFNPKSNWSHNNKQSHLENQHHKERSAQNNQRTFIERKSRTDYVYPGKINHEDQEFKSNEEYDENYDNRQSHHENENHHKDSSYQAQSKQTRNLEKTSGTDYDVDPGKVNHEDQYSKNEDEYDEYDDYEENEENEENENTIEVQREDIETEDVIPDMLNKSDSQKDMAESKKEAAYAFRDENHRRGVGIYHNSEEYVNDDPDQGMSLTDKKIRDLGRPGAVQEQFLKFKVHENEQRLKREGSCHLPHPKVIPILDPSDRFIPHCAVLHRCADDTGCCNDDFKTCAPKTYTKVKLYFYITPIVKDPFIDFKEFDNHTECHCVYKSIRFRRASRLNSFAFGPNAATSNESCRCPSNFRAIKERTQCRCDCLSWNQKCYDLKEGKDQFPYDDQKCILENKCVKPSCEYGHYNRHSGRCPKLSKSSSRRNYRYDPESKILNGPS